MNDVNSPVVSRPSRDLRCCRTRARRPSRCRPGTPSPAAATTARSSPSCWCDRARRRPARTAPPRCPSVPNALTMRWPENASAARRARASRGAPGCACVRAPHLLPEPHERIDDDRRAGEADQRQPRIGVEQQDQVADERQPLAHQIADRLRHRLLDLGDVARHARQQLAAGAPREEGSPTGPRMWPKSAFAHVAHDELADVGHQVGRQVGADALEQIDGDDGPPSPRTTRSWRTRTSSTIGLDQ